MLRVPTSLPLLAAVVLSASAHARSIQSAAPSDRVLTFLAAPPAQQPADPAVALPCEPFETRAGDVLVYRVRVPDARGGARGIEVSYADGRRTLAARASATGTWEEVRVPLREESTVRTVELVARGCGGGQVVFQVDDVRVERAEGAAVEVFRDELAGGLLRVSGLPSSAGAVVTALDAEVGPEFLRPGSDVSDPWAAIDLSALCALEREADPVDATLLPRGLVWTGPCVPLRFARGSAPVSFAARGQRIGFDPLDGGRFYELWLAVVNTSGAEIETAITVQGVDRERVAVPLRVPAGGPDGYAPRDGEGYPARGYALLEIDVASPASLASLQLPEDPRLRVLAVTIAWRRDGATDPRFRARWLSRAAASLPELADSDRADLARYIGNRRAGAIFGGVVDEGDGERALFDALLAGEKSAFRERLTERLAAQSAAGQGRKSARIDLIAALPFDDDLGAALAEGVLPADLPVVGGDAASIEALAARDPAALARLVERARAGTWRTFASSLDRRSASRLGADGLARRLSFEKLATERLLGSSSNLARVEGELGRIAHLPQMLASSGTRTVLIESASKKLGAPFALWESAGVEVATVAPFVRIEGPLRLDPAIWRGWTAAAAGSGGRPPIPVLCDVSAPSARETLAHAAELVPSEMAPDLRWSSLVEVAEAARPRARRSDTPALAPLARAGMHAELEASAAVRGAERELARSGVVEALALLDGAPEPGRHLAAAWRGLHRAAELEAPRAAAGARAVGQRAQAAATARLARLQVATPPPGKGVALAILDPLPWARRSLLELPDGELRVANHEGDLAAQRSSTGGMLFEFLGAGTTPTALLVRRDPLAETKAPARVRLEGWTIRTDDLEVAIDPATGGLTRLRLPSKDLEFLREGGDQLSWVAPGSAPEPIGVLEKIEFVERGPLRAIVRSVRSSARARVETEIRVTSGAAGLEIQTRVELFDRGGDVVATFPLAHAAANALVSIPLGFAAVSADAANLRALDGWAAATDGTATFALLGESGLSFRWNERAFEVVLAEAGAESARSGAFAVLARPAGWKSAGLDAAMLERAMPPLRVAFTAPGGAASPREPLVRIARIERDGRRVFGPASGIVPLAIQPGPDGTIEVRLADVRGEASNVEVSFAREPFGAERVDLLGRGLGALTVTGRGLDVSVGPGRFEIVRARLAP
ncbi:MAG: hypothetical protein NTY35_17390 [Planctomycetota bacterium]|nr:hypothetical protein [Planctomycetota bacterium]